MFLTQGVDSGVWDLAWGIIYEAGRTQCPIKSLSVPPVFPAPSFHPLTGSSLLRPCYLPDTTGSSCYHGNGLWHKQTLRHNGCGDVSQFTVFPFCCYGNRNLCDLSCSLQSPPIASPDCFPWHSIARGEVNKVTGFAPFSCSEALDALSKWTTNSHTKPSTEDKHNYKTYWGLPASRWVPYNRIIINLDCN